MFIEDYIEQGRKERNFLLLQNGKSENFIDTLDEELYEFAFRQGFKAGQRDMCNNE